MFISCALVVFVFVVLYDAYLIRSMFVCTSCVCYLGAYHLFVYLHTCVFVCLIVRYCFCFVCLFICSLLSCLVYLFVCMFLLRVFLL